MKCFNQESVLKLAQLAENAEGDVQLGFRCGSERQAGRPEPDARNSLDGRTEQGVRQDAAVLTGGLAEAIHRNEELLGLLVLTLLERLEDRADLVAEDVSAAGDDAHRALHDRRQEHDVIAVVNDEVRIDLLGSEEEIGDLRRVDTGLVLHADDVGDGSQTADGLRLEVDADEDGCCRA